MPGKNRTEEEGLISRIKSYRREFISALENKFLQERDGRHRDGEVFFEGYWVPKDLVPKLQRKLSGRGAVVFFEVHFLALVVLVINILLYIIFRKFILP